MHIEIITDTFPPDINGVANTLDQFVKSLKDKGHQVYVHTPTKGIHPNVIKQPYFLRSPIDQNVKFTFPKAKALRKRWKKERPDAIYVATETPFGYSAMKVAKSLGIRVVSGFHTNFDEYISRYNLNKLRPAAQAWLARFHNSADLTIAPSQGTIEKLRQIGVEKTQLVGRGVNCTDFSPSYRNYNIRKNLNGQTVFLYVGRLAPEKNLDLAVKAYREVDNAVLWFVGDGPEEQRLKLLCPEAKFWGRLSGRELSEVYASADVFLFPSKSETFGNVVLEAMASSLLVVCFNYAAGEKYIRHAENGFKAELDNDREFIEYAILSHKMVQETHRPVVQQQARVTAGLVGWNKPVKDFISALATPEEPEQPAPEHCRTIFFSDLHLGTKGSQSEAFVDFLNNMGCDLLVGNGDIVDGWALKSGSKWREKDTIALNAILDKDCQKIIVSGNHDEFLREYEPLEWDRISLTREFVYTTKRGKKYLVLHGDGFDMVVTKYPWLAKLGGLSYNALLWLNHWHYKWLAFRGKPPYSLSKVWKQRVKSAVQFVSKYEQVVVDLAKKRECDGVIVGHIHTPDSRKIDGIHYVNTGDWVESLSYVIENDEGELELKFFS